MILEAIDWHPPVDVTAPNETTARILETSLMIEDASGEITGTAFPLSWIVPTMVDNNPFFRTATNPGLGVHAMVFGPASCRYPENLATALNELADLPFTNKISRPTLYSKTLFFPLGDTSRVPFDTCFTEKEMTDINAIIESHGLKPQKPKDMVSKVTIDDTSFIIGVVDTSFSVIADFLSDN